MSTYCLAFIEVNFEYDAQNVTPPPSQLHIKSFILFHYFTIILTSLKGSFKKSAVIRTADYQLELSSNCDRVQTNLTSSTIKMTALYEFSDLSACPVYGTVAFRLMVTKLRFTENIRNKTFFMCQY